MHSSMDDTGRRRFLARVVTTIHAAIAGTLGVILGGAVSSPIFGRQQENWIPAASLNNLPQNEPTPVTLRIAREDGYREVIDRRTVFLVRTGDNQVTALDSTCTHLGCRVSWDPEAQLLKCPCHGGQYDKTGAVKAGPPPAPLARMTTRVDGDQILVQV
jgi:menaquinol-cytochrome c reductase iron-sulfur subunit